MEFSSGFLDNIPENGEWVSVVGVSNISRGGEAHDVTDSVSKENIDLAEKAAKSLGLFAAGVDIIIDETGRGSVIEVEENPGMRIHKYPHVGESINLAKAFLAELFS